MENKVTYCIILRRLRKLNLRPRKQCLFVFMMVSTLFYMAINYFLVANTVPTYSENDTLQNKEVIILLKASLILDKGTGCDYPELDPFDKELVKYDVDMPKIVCEGKDWVNCYQNECYVIKEIVEKMEVSCIYKDIIYIDDNKFVLGEPVTIDGNNNYTLVKSDFVKVSCTGKSKTGFNLLNSKWHGYRAGLRMVETSIPVDRENSLNVIMFAFDSTSRNRFIRGLPKSYKYVIENLGATLLKGYNIVSGGTIGALLPIFTGKNENELPDVRKTISKNLMDEKILIFHTMKKDGYRTAYFEEMPWIGTFQYRFNGFQKQPADHYLRAFFKAETNEGNKRWQGTQKKFCVGDKPRYQMLMDLNKQFLETEGKKFGFTISADVTHDDINLISNADDALLEFMTELKESGKLNNTLFILMADHGSSHFKERDSVLGYIEERQPFMAIRLPEELKERNKDAQKNLEANSRVLTTPYDIHSTILDAVNLSRLDHTYFIPGADIPRGLSLLKPIPKTRACGEAGIEPHYCLCIKWEDIPRTNPHFRTVPRYIADYINGMILEYRSLCAERKLKSIAWVRKKDIKRATFLFSDLKGINKFIKQPAGLDIEHYMAKIIMTPSTAVYEATVTYYKTKDVYAVSDSDVSRINAYKDEPHCISETMPHLNKYCYCIVQFNSSTTLIDNDTSTS